MHNIYVPSVVLSFIMIFTAYSIQFNNHLLNISLNQLTPDAQRQVMCLAENIYHEAGYEREDGKLAVGLVTLNRVQHPHYPKDICSVVNQKIKSTCQFSWKCEEKQTNKTNSAWKTSLDSALLIYANYDKIEDITNGALFYHADYVNPGWRNLQKTTVIGRHIFYK